MKYFYNPPLYQMPLYGEIYICDHPMFHRATLYMVGNRGLLVVQQRYNVIEKTIQWGPIDPWLSNDIYIHPKFLAYFNDHAEEMTADGMFPVVSVRSLMWGLRMKPLKHEFWEDWKGE